MNAPTDPFFFDKTDLFNKIKRNDSIKILGDSLAESLGTLSVITRRIYFFPVQFQTQVKISNLRINVTKTSSNSLCSIGIYTNKKASSGNDTPGDLLKYVDTLVTNTNGDVTAESNFIFNKDTVYWVGVLFNGAPTIRALTIANLYAHLGRAPNSNNAYTHLYKNLNTYVLPQTAPEDLTISTGNIPAVYIVE